MSTASPTFGQLKAQAAAIHQKVPHARVFGIHASGRWTGDREKRDGERAYLIYQCDSPLAMRQALREVPDADDTTTILVTPLEDKELSEDILLRLAKRRVIPLDSWQTVRSLFQAQTVDPAIASQGWLASMLVDLLPPEGYPAAKGGFLDAETVWPLLLHYGLGLPAGTPDPTTLLKWSLQPEASGRLRAMGDAFYEAASTWLAARVGPIAELVLSCVARLERPDAVPLGLAAGVVYHEAATGKLERAAGKLEERFFGRAKPPEVSLIQRWAIAATEVARSLQHTDQRVQRQTLQRADEILAEVQAEGFAYLSDVLPVGFNQRLTHFGERLSDVLDRKAWKELDNLAEAQRAIRGHDQSAKETRRLQRAEMAVRLVRWLGERSGQTGSQSGSLAEAAVVHLREGGFVDWARLCLRSGDAVRVLSEAYAKLFEVVTEIRESDAQRFARLLTDWTAADSLAEEVVPVEHVLEEVVAPLAAKNPVLLIVMDGMSAAVCRELLADLDRYEWVPLCEEGRDYVRPGIATIPSVTEFSRTSLLTGNLRPGAAADERAGFAEHPALVGCCRSGYPPVLFHKPTLQENEDAVLAADVRKEIASAHRKIVGVVVNAVDDNLLKGGQMDTQWTRDEIRVLPALLHEARMARRVVVLVSDHGHVLDSHTELRPGEGGERWREARGEPADDELQVEGRRVLVEGRRLIAPWTERVRYGGMKNGYHGGLTPQEMVIPVVVLAGDDKYPAGWHEQPVDIPTWWDEPSPAEPVAPQPPPKLKPSEPEPGMLFDIHGAEESPEEPMQEGEPSPVWVQRLLASAVFMQQKQLGGRGLPGDEVFSKLLSTLDEKGGKMTSVALARALEFPALRLPGLLAKVQRVLNIDGYAVLSRDDASDTVELNRELLLRQFDLVEEG